MQRIARGVGVPALLLLLPFTMAAAGEAPLRGDFAHHFRFLEEPRPAPPYAFQQADGGDRALGEFAGRVVIATFWATWCGICSRELPKLDRLQQQLGAEGLTVLALAQDDVGVAGVRRFYEERGVRHLGIYFDREAILGTLMGIRGVPTSFLIDREGRVRGRVEGAAAWDSPEARAFLRHYLGSGAAPEPSAEESSAAEASSAGDP